MSYPGQSNGCKLFLDEVNKHIQAGHELTSRQIKHICDYRTNKDFIKELRKESNRPLQNKIIAAAYNDAVFANMLLNTFYAYTKTKLKENKEQQRILGDTIYIIFKPTELIDILIKHKNVPKFLENNLRDNNKYFDLRSIAQEDTDAFKRMISIPELLAKLNMTDIKKITKAIEKKDKETALDIAKTFAELASGINDLNEYKRTDYLKLSADLGYLPAKTQLVLGSFLGMYGTTKKEEERLTGLVSCYKEAEKIQDNDVKTMIENFFAINEKKYPDLKQTVMMRMHRKESTNMAKSSLFTRSTTEPSKEKIEKPRPKRI